MNALVTQEPVSAETLEQVLGTGDLSKLTSAQRVEYMTRTCQSLGLNPLTRPFRFLTFQGQTQMYATRDCADQLRASRKISLAVIDKSIEGEVYTVTVRARTPDGREDEDIGAVAFARLVGEARANATMKAITKAKRRATLSICGLGYLDESEVDTLPGAMTFDAEDRAPIVTRDMAQRERINEEVPLQPAAAAMPRPPRKVEEPPKKQVERTDAQWEAWLDKLKAACEILQRRSEVEEVAARPTVSDALASPDTPPFVKREIDSILFENFRRFPEEPEALDDDPFAPGLEITGQEKLAAG